MFGYSKRVKVFALFLSIAIGAVSLGAAPATKRRPAKTPAKSSTAKPAVKKSSTPATKKPVATRKKASVKHTAKPASPPRQQQPTSDRYRAIQQALIDRGFLDGEATGQWDQQSINALKKFERSQHLKEDGKIDSMILIALGLGPERTQAANQLLVSEVPSTLEKTTSEDSSNQISN